MNKHNFLLALGVVLALALMLNSVSAYNYGFVKVSDGFTFGADVSGENQGFSFKRSLDVPRVERPGFYDYSYNSFRETDRSRSIMVSDKLGLEALRTFREVSKDQTRLELAKIRERNRYSYGYFGYGGYGGYGGGYYGGYYGSYYPSSYGYYRYGFWLISS